MPLHLSGSQIPFGGKLHQNGISVSMTHEQYFHATIFVTECCLLDILLLKIQDDIHEIQCSAFFMEMNSSC